MPFSCHQQLRTSPPSNNPTRLSKQLVGWIWISRTASGSVALLASWLRRCQFVPNVIIDSHSTFKRFLLSIFYFHFLPSPILIGRSGEHCYNSRASIAVLNIEYWRISLFYLTRVEYHNNNPIQKFQAGCLPFR